MTTTALTEEGSGTVATCQRCGWLIWSSLRTEAQRRATGHRCRESDPCLLCRFSRRLSDDDCTHGTTAAQR